MYLYVLLHRNLLVSYLDRTSRNEIASPAHHKLRALAMDATAIPPTTPAQPKKQKTRSLEDILRSLGSYKDVSFAPFQPEPKQEARAILPLSFPKNPYPFDYFSLFFIPALFRTITTNTNRYATLQKIKVPQERAREWTDLLVEELYVFLGVVIYMGIHDEPQIEMYWNTDFNRGPLHSITNHISLCRFE
jgi:hypothetical protein